MDMGVNLNPIIGEYKKTVKFSDLGNKVIAIDAYNTIYQFLTTIRDHTGMPLRDREGRVTSHLSGLFYRNVNLLKERIKLVYVFDGRPPIRKLKELERRKVIKRESFQKYLEALERKDYEEARKYAAMAATLEDYMVEDSKRLLELLGIPIVQAPSEGEAQASYMAMKGDVWAVGSQDYDSFLFGAPRIVRNITLTGKIRYPSKGIEVKLEPELVRLEDILKGLGLTREQLVDIGILIGTDYNEGVKGIGPKRALELIKTYGTIDKIPEARQWFSNEDVEEIRKLFLSPEVTDDYKLEFKDVDYDGVVKFLCDEHDFSVARVTKALDDLKKVTSIKSLDQWF
jgi:flap endonuclease-1